MKIFRDLTPPKSSWQDEFPFLICEVCKKKSVGFVECTQTNGAFLVVLCFFFASCIQTGIFCILVTCPWKDTYRRRHRSTTGSLDLSRDFPRIQDDSHESKVISHESKVMKMKRYLMVAACIMRHTNREVNPQRFTRVFF